MARLASWLLLPALLAGCASTEDGEPAGVVGFEGVEAYSVSRLREIADPDVRRFKKEGKLTALDDAAWRIVARYRQEGYARARVSHRVEKDAVVFSVEEGSRFILSRIHFEGNEAISGKELSQLVPGGGIASEPPYSVRVMTLVEEEIVAAYRRLGYLEAVVSWGEPDDPDRDGRVGVTFRIAEGRRYSVSMITGLPDDPELAAKLREAVGKPYSAYLREELEAAIVDHGREHGHPRASARVRPKLEKDSGAVTLEIDSRPGPKAAIGEVRVKGKVWSRESFVKARSLIEEGEPYRASDLRKAEERLMETRAFQRVRAAPLTQEEEGGRIPIELEIVEREPGEASIRAGYGSFERLRVGADIGGRNIWGGAESIRVGGSVSNVGVRGETELGIPYVMATDLRFGVTTYYEDREYPSYDAQSLGGVVSVAYPFLEDRLVVATGVRRARIRTDDVEPGVPPGDLLDFDYLAAFVTPVLDLRDNPLLPSRGMLASLDLAVSPGRASDLEFTSLAGRVTGYLPLPWGIVGAASVQGGLIVPRGETREIPISLRYFAGGTTTVRGFAFDSIGPEVNGEPTGGEVYLAVQTELRIPVWADFQAAVFHDRGGVWFDHRDFDLDETRWSAGLGVRYATPAGALVADVGWNPHREPGEHAVELHLSVGFPF